MLKVLPWGRTSIRPVVLTSHLDVIHVLAAPLLISSLFVAWESSSGWLKSLGSCTHIGNLGEAPRFALT